MSSQFTPQQMGQFGQTSNMFSGLSSMLGGFLNGQQSYPNPANSAMPYYSQIPGMISPYYQQFINSGTQMLPTLSNQLQQMINNPGGVTNSIGANYHESPGYNFQVNQATNAANHAAAAGGMAGSPQEQQQLAGTVNGLANQDYYQYLNNAEGVMNQGLQGGQNIAQMGYGASNNLAQALASIMMNQGNLAYAGTANQNQMNGMQAGQTDSMLTNGLSSLGTAAAFAGLF
jgi:hypothetical protein